MSLTIKTPNAAYEGTIAGVRFRKGLGLFEDEALGKTIAADFKFEVVKAHKKAAPKAPEKEAEKEPAAPKAAAKK